MPIPNTNLTWLATGEPLTGGANTTDNDGVLNRPLVQLLANDNNLQTQIDNIISGTLALSAAAIKGALSATDPNGIENAQIQTNAAIAETKLNLSLTSTTNVTTGVAYVDTAEMATLINSLYNAQIVSSSAIETSRLNIRTQIPSGFLSPFNLPQDDITRGTVGVDASSDGTICTRTDKYDGVQIPWGDKFLNKLHVNCDGIIFSLEGLNTDIINDTLLYKAGTFDRYVVSTEYEINQDPDIDTATNQITVKEVYEAGTLVRVESSGTIPTPLAENTDYYVIYIDDTTIQLATNLTDALSSQNPINITDDGIGSFHIHRYIGDLNQGDKIQHLACDHVNPVRQDLVFLEFWAENVDNSSGIVFPSGQVQNGNEDQSPTAVDYRHTVNAVSVGDPNFLAEYIGDRKNYTWVQENGDYAQWRFRVRIVEDADSILSSNVLVQGPRAFPVTSEFFSLSPNDTGLYKSERTLVGTEYGIDQSTAVNTTDNEITVTVDYDNGTPDNGRLVRVSSTGTMPTGLLENVDYFVIRINATTIRLATSYADAIAGTAIDITGIGSGFLTINRYDSFNDEELVSDYVGAVPICAIHRRNRGAFHPSWNPNGTAVIVQPTTVSRAGSTTVSASVYEPFGEGIESSFTTNFNGGGGGFTLNEDLFDHTIIGAYCPVTRQWDVLSNLGETSKGPANINTGTNQLTGLTNQWYDGEAFIFRAHDGTVMPSGLAENVRYYANNVTASSITVHASYDDAINNVDPIGISSTGVGNWDMVVEDSKYDGTNYWYRSGYTASGTSGRPDDLFYDRVDRYDIEDQRHRVTFDGFDIENLMINNMNLLFQGGLLNDFNEQFVSGAGEDYTISSGIKGRAVLSIDGLYNTYPSGAEANNSVVKLLDFSDGVYVEPSTGTRYKQRAQVDDLRRTWSDATTVSTMTEELEYPVTPGGLGTGNYTFSKITTDSPSLNFTFQFNAGGGTHYVENVKVEIAASNVSGDFENASSDPLQRVVKLVAPDIATSGPFNGNFFLGFSTDGITYTNHRVVSPNYNYRTGYTLQPDGRSLTIDLKNGGGNGFAWDETTETLYVRWSFVMEYPAGGGLTNPIVTQFDLVDRDKIKRNYKNTRDCYLVEEKRGFYEASPTHWDRRGAMQRLFDFSYNYYNQPDTAFITERWGDGWFPTRPEDCNEIIIPGNSSYRIYIDDVLPPRLKGRWGYIDKVHIETGSTLGNLTTWSGGTGTVDFTDFDIIWHRPAGDLADRQWIEIENKNVATRFVKFAFSYTSIIEYIKPSNNVAGDDPLSEGPLNYVGKAFETVNQTKEFSYNGDKAIQRKTVGGAEVDWDGWASTYDVATSPRYDANNIHYGNSAASPIAWIYSPSTASNGAQDDEWHMTYVGEGGEVVAYISSGSAGPDNFKPYFTGIENETLDDGNTQIYVGDAVSQFTVGDKITFRDLAFQTGITQLLYHNDASSGFVNNKDWQVYSVDTANQTIQVALTPFTSPETFIDSGTFAGEWNGVYRIQRREDGHPTEPSDIKAEANIGTAHAIHFSELNPSVQSLRAVAGVTGNVNTVWEDHIVEHYHIQGNTYSHLFSRPSLKDTTNIHLYSTTAPKNVETSLDEVKGILQVDSFYVSLAGSGGRREIQKDDLRFWDSAAQDGTDLYQGLNRSYDKVQGEFMLFRYLAHYINTTKPKYYYNPNEHMTTVPFDLHAIHQLYTIAAPGQNGPEGGLDRQFRLMDYDYVNVDNSLISFQHNRLANSPFTGKEVYPSEPWKYGQNGLTAGRGSVDPSETLEALSGEGLGPTIELYEPFVAIGTPAFLPQNLKFGGDYMMIVPNMYIDEQEIKGLILESSSYNYPSFQAHQIDTRFTLLGRPLINRKDNT